MKIFCPVVLFLILYLFSSNFLAAQPPAYLEAIDLAQNGQAKEGFLLLQNKLGEDTENTEIIYHIGLYLEQVKQIQKAEQYYQKAIDISPAHSSALFRLGMLYEKRDSLSMALDYYTKAIPEASEEEKMAILPRLFVASDKLSAKSEEVFQIARLYYDDHTSQNISPPVALALASLLYRAGDYHKSIALTDNILSSTGGSSYPIQKAALIHTSSAFRLHDFDKMNLYISRIRDKGLKVTLESTAPQYYYNLGYAYFSIYEFDKSVRYLKTALTLKPDYVPAQVFLNQVESRKRDKSDFIQHLRTKIKASRFESHDASYYADLTRLYVYEQRYNQAVKVADSCLSLEPKREEVYFLKTIAFFHTNKDKEGIQSAQEALHLFTKTKADTKAKYYLVLGLLYKRLQNYQKAELSFQKAKMGVFSDAADWELSKMRE